METWKVAEVAIIIKKDEVSELDSQSEARLFAYVFSLYLIFIPLLWGWIRCALSLIKGMHNNDLRHKNAWINILRIVPATTMGILAGVFFSTLAYSCECIKSHWLLVLAMAVFGLISSLLSWMIWYISKSISAELVTISDISDT